MNIIFYTTNCPKCSSLKNKLNAKSLSYTECSDTEIMLKKGIVSVPALEIDNKIFSYKDAIKFLNNMEG